jgi:hypothetical protein
MFQHLSLAYLAAADSVSIAEWRWAILALGICAILLTFGFIATGIFLFRKKNTDRTLLYFGVYVILYGLRVFLRASPLLPVFAISPSVADHIIRAITFTFSLPLLFLFLEIVEAPCHLVGAGRAIGIRRYRDSTRPNWYRPTTSRYHE